MDPTDLFNLMFGISPAAAATPGVMPSGSFADSIMRSTPQPLEFPQPGPMLPPTPPAMTPPPDPAAAAAVSTPTPTPYPDIARRYPGPPPTLGSALEPVAGPAVSGVPMPKPRHVDLGASSPPAAATKEQPKPGDDALLKTLRGVQAPKPPEAQKVSTPHLPALRPIQGGGYLDLLAQLGLGQQAAARGGLQLPSTLGQALGGR